MTKEVFVVNVNNYQPEISSLTIPTIKAYAERIGAKFTQITERKYPELPPTYEKLQIYELGKNNDYNILIDADMAILPTMYDVTRLIQNGQVGVWMTYDPSVTIAFDEYLLTGEKDAIALNYFVSTKAVHEKVWKPLEFSVEDIRRRMKRLFVVDEYAVSRNLAEHGIPCEGVILPKAEEHFLHCNVTTDSKNICKMVKVLEEFLHPEIMKQEPYVFVQIGSFTGNDMISNVLRSRLKAQVLLVEPVPYHFEMLKKNYLKYSDRVHFENSAVSEVDGEVDFFVVEPTGDFLEQLSSIKFEVIDGHHTGVKSNKVRCKSINPKTLVEKYSLTAIDFLVIDTEGYDLNILKVFPFESVKPEKILFEYKHLDGAFKYEKGLKEAFSLLKSHGYNCEIVDQENALATLI
jgi:FkbM family methyltransferase